MLRGDVVVCLKIFYCPLLKAQTSRMGTTDLRKSICKKIKAKSVFETGYCKESKYQYVKISEASMYVAEIEKIKVK